MNRRRLILAAAIAPTLGLPTTVRAQSKKGPVVIGWLHTESPKGNEYALPAFKQGMAELGRKEGSGYVIEEFWADGQLDRLAGLAEQLKERRPSVIVAASAPATQAAAKASQGTPVVQADGGTPVSSGLAESLARPGRIVTGLTNSAGEVSEKYLELLLAAAPGFKRIGFLIDSAASTRAMYLEKTRHSAARYSVEAQFAEVARPEEIESAISRLGKGGVQALVLMPSGWQAGERARIVKLALANRLPLVAGNPAFAEAGALLTYGADRGALYRRAAWYVDKILKGAKPGDLPIEQPTKFELVVNLKTAKALGLTLPQSFLMRADRVIE